MPGQEMAGLEMMNSLAQQDVTCASITTVENTGFLGEGESFSFLEVRLL